MAYDWKPEVDQSYTFPKIVCSSRVLLLLSSLQLFFGAFHIPLLPTPIQQKAAFDRVKFTLKYV